MSGFAGVCLGKKPLSGHPGCLSHGDQHRGGHASQPPPWPCHRSRDRFLEQVGALVCSHAGEHVPGQPPGPAVGPGARRPPPMPGHAEGRDPVFRWLQTLAGELKGAGITVFKYCALSAFPGNRCFHGKRRLFLSELSAAFGGAAAPLPPNFTPRPAARSDASAVNKPVFGAIKLPGRSGGGAALITRFLPARSFARRKGCAAA